MRTRGGGEEGRCVGVGCVLGVCVEPQRGGEGRKVYCFDPDRVRVTTAKSDERPAWSFLSLSKLLCQCPKPQNAFVFLPIKYRLHSGVRSNLKFETSAPVVNYVLVENEYQQERCIMWGGWIFPSTGATGPYPKL
eukprot:768273-Hanusia_phi.AAC.1